MLGALVSLYRAVDIIERRTEPLLSKTFGDSRGLLPKNSAKQHLSDALDRIENAMKELEKEPEARDG